MINNAIPGAGSAFAGYYETPRRALLALLGARRPRAALEIGCGGGTNLAVLKQLQPQCRTTGVELRAEAAQAALLASRVDTMCVGNVLDEETVSFEDGAFDLIILSHVLEHFAQPEAVLARARRWLASGGCMLIALPNLRHASVLVDLLLRGDFRYRPAGIMDSTHLRFYTRKSACRFLAEQGLLVDACVPDIEGPKARLFHRLTLGLGRDLAAYAYNFRVHVE